MTTCLQRPSFWSPNLSLYNTNLPLNNDHLSTTTTYLGSRGWSLYTRLTVYINDFLYLFADHGQIQSTGRFLTGELYLFLLAEDASIFVQTCSQGKAQICNSLLQINWWVQVSLVIRGRHFPVINMIENYEIAIRKSNVRFKLEDMRPPSICLYWKKENGAKRY
jgi:hypothetical protein